MNGLWVFLLEAFVALSLLVFIVLWTMPRKDKSERNAEKDDEAES
jgi:hypothetical protein